MIPVYLFAKQPGELVLEHECLEFRHPGKSARLLPLRQVSSIVIAGPVSVHTEALLQCVRTGIDVTFLDGMGRAMARLESLEPPPTRVARRIEALCMKPDWAALYERWVRAMERQAILRALRGRSITLHELRMPALLRASIESELADQFDREAVNDLSTRLTGYLRALVQAGLSGRRLGNVTAPAVPNAPPLGKDLLGIARWHLETLRSGELLAHARWQKKHGQTARPARERHLLDCFEHQRPRLEREVTHLLDRFEQWLVEETA